MTTRSNLYRLYLVIVLSVLCFLHRNAQLAAARALI